MADAPQSDNGNGKVTLALIGQKLDFLIERYEKSEQDKEARIRCLETSQTTQEQKIGTLESKVNSWSLVNSVGAAVGVVLAYLGITK